MKILIYEAVTAGLLDEATSKALFEEADVMVQAAIRDFADLPDVQIEVPRQADAPLPPSDAAVDRYSINHHPDVPFRRGADHALIIAPESLGLLAQLSKACDAAGIHRLGSSLEAIEVTSNKLNTAHALHTHGIPTPPVYHGDAALPPLASGYVIKPIDGCGSEGVQRLMDRSLVETQLRAQNNLLAMPFVSGIDASALVFFKEADVHLLSLNRQKVTWTREGLIDFKGVETGVMECHRELLSPLIHRIKKAIPGLYGFVGIDFLFTEKGPVIIEINPRLTSAYPTLRAYLGHNPARYWFEETAS